MDFQVVGFPEVVFPAAAFPAVVFQGVAAFQVGRPVDSAVHSIRLICCDGSMKTITA